MTADHFAWKEEITNGMREQFVDICNTDEAQGSIISAYVLTATLQISEGEICKQIDMNDLMESRATTSVGNTPGHDDVAI